MEYRNYDRTLRSRLLEHDTLLAPQLEDYDVIAPTDNKLPPFKLVINVTSVAPKELELTLLEDKTLQVKALHRVRQFMGLAFARDCTIRYALPDEVDKDKLVAKWYRDHFVVICEEDELSSTSEPSAVSVNLDQAAGEGVSGLPSGSGVSFRGLLPATEVSSGGSVPVASAVDSPSGSDPSGEEESSSSGLGGSITTRDDSLGSVTGAEKGSGPPDAIASEGLRAGCSECVAAEEGLQSGTETGSSGVKVLKPVYVNRKFKPFIDVSDVLERFSLISDIATYAENYVDTVNFTSPNVGIKRLQGLKIPK